MKIEAHESALDSIKAIGQRDKERIEELEATLRGCRGLICQFPELPSMVKATRLVDKVLMVNTYSTAIIQKAE